MSFAELHTVIAAQARAVGASGGDGAAHHALARLAESVRPLGDRAARQALAEAADAAQADREAPGRVLVRAEIQAGAFLLEVLTEAGTRPPLRRALETLLLSLERSGVSAELLADSHRALAEAKARAKAERAAALAARRAADARRVACFVEVLQSAERSERPLTEALSAMRKQKPTLTAAQWRAVAQAVTGRKTASKAAAEAALRQWIALVSTPPRAAGTREIARGG